MLKAFLLRPYSQSSETKTTGSEKNVGNGGGLAGNKEHLRNTTAKGADGRQAQVTSRSTCASNVGSLRKYYASDCNKDKVYPAFERIAQLKSGPKVLDHWLKCLRTLLPFAVEFPLPTFAQGSQTHRPDTKDTLEPSPDLHTTVVPLADELLDSYPGLRGEQYGQTSKSSSRERNMLASELSLQREVLYPMVKRANAVFGGATGTRKLLVTNLTSG